KQTEGVLIVKGHVPHRIKKQVTRLNCFHAFRQACEEKQRETHWPVPATRHSTQARTSNLMSVSQSNGTKSAPATPLLSLPPVFLQTLAFLLQWVQFMP